MGRQLLSVVCLVLAVSHDPDGDGCDNNQLLARLCIKILAQVRTNMLWEDCAPDRVFDNSHTGRTHGGRCCMTSLGLRVSVLTGSPSTVTRGCPNRLTPNIENIDSFATRNNLLNMQVSAGTFEFRGIIDEDAEDESRNYSSRHVTLKYCVLFGSSSQLPGGVPCPVNDTVMRQYQHSRPVYIHTATPGKLQTDPKLSLLPGLTSAMILLPNLELSFRLANVIVVWCHGPYIITIYITFDHVRVSYQVEEKELQNIPDTSWTAEASVCSQERGLKPTVYVWSKATTFFMQGWETIYRILAPTLRTVLHNIQHCLYCPYVNLVAKAFQIIVSPFYQSFSIFTPKSSSIVCHRQSANVYIIEINNGGCTSKDEKVTSADTEHKPHLRHGCLGQSLVTFIVFLMLVFIPHLTDSIFSIFGLKDLSEDHQCGGREYFSRWFGTSFAEGCKSEKKSCNDCKMSEQGCDGSSSKSRGLWSLSKKTTLWKHLLGNFGWKLFQKKPPTLTKNSVFQKQLDTWGKHTNIAPLWLTGFHVWPLDRFLPDASRNPEQDMAYLGYRLATLGALPVTCGVSRLKLADAGFYYRGQGDEVVCYSCRVRHSGWRASDDPLAVHRHISPHCSHLAKTIQAAPNYQTGEHGSQGHEASGSRSGSEVVGGGADPMEDGEQREQQDANEAVANSSFASGPSRATHSVHNGVAEAGSHHPTPGGQASRNLFPSPSLDLGGAVYPMYQDMASRRRSFARWDESQAPPLEDILLNGMFYAGYADCVRCFYCGVGLKSWEPSDDVWSEHTRWRPNCQYLRTVKGDDYIHRTVTRLNREADSDADAAAAITAVRNDNSRAEPPAVTPASGPTGSPPTTTTTTASSASPHIIAEQPPATTAREQPSTSTSAMSSPQDTTGGSPAEHDSNDHRNNSSNVPGRRGPGIGVVLPNEESSRERLNRLRQENRELAGRLQCRVCHNHPIDTIFLPCGHLLACDSCTATLRECPQCHEYIQATARVHTG